MTRQVTQMVIKTIKANYNYKYNKVDGFIYVLDDNQYFINNEETYFKTIK